MAVGTDMRRSPRIPLDQFLTEMEVGGVSYPVHVADLSQEGIRVMVDTDVPIDPQQEVKIAVGKISPNVRGRVRWVAPHEPGQPAQMGIEFVSFLLEQPTDDQDVQGLLDAWREISHSYSVMEAFLQIVIALDTRIVDGLLDDLSEAVYSVAVWMDERVGPLNLWGVLKERDGTLSAQLIAERHTMPPPRNEARQAHVLRVAREEMTAWLDGHPYLFGGEVVVEYLGDNEGQQDLLQRLAVLLSKRMQFWSKLLMKNISLQLFGDELERLQRK